MTSRVRFAVVRGPALFWIDCLVVVVAVLIVERVVDPAEDPVGVTRTTVTDLMKLRLPLGRVLILV